MISARFSKFVAGLSLLAASAASAAGAQDIVHVKLLEPYAPPNMAAVTAFGFYMSPYSGTVAGTMQRLNCVDFFHDVDTGDEWDAARVNLGDAINDHTLLSFTRDGVNGSFLDLSGHVDLGKVLIAYEEAAWLSAQIPANPGGKGTQPNASSKTTIAIQTAIWSIIDVPNTQAIPEGKGYLKAVPLDIAITADTTVTSVNRGDVFSTAYWIRQAAEKYKLQSADYYGAFNLITDVYKMNNGQYAVDLTPASKQSFLYMTPEPATLGLMATGFGMIGYVARRRRKKPKVE